MPAIINTELKVFRAANTSDLSSNGGRLSATVLASGVLGALFPNVDDAERTAGSTKYRKMFFKADHNGPETLLAARVYQDKNPVGSDYVTFFPGTQTDTQASLSGTERKYGGGILTTTVSAGATSLSVTLKPGMPAVFVNGDTIRITDKASIADTGNEEFVTIDGSVSVVGSVATFNITPALTNGYSATLSRVESCYQAGNVVANYTGNSVTSGAGTIDWSKLVLNDKSCVEQTYTLTFTSATAFDIVGSVSGALGSGSTATGASPNNPDFSLPFFTLQSAAFGGTFATGNTIVFTTHPAAVPIWLQRVVPAGAATAASETSTFVIDGGAV